MMHGLVLLFAFGASRPAAVIAPASIAPPRQEQQDFAALQADWEHALADWERAYAEAKDSGVKRRDRPPHPAIAYWPRFASAADAGEAAAIDWMLANLRDAFPKRSERVDAANALLARFEKTPDAPWVAHALPALAQHRRDLDETRYGGLLDDLAKEGRASGLRVAALLARAELAEKEDDAAASELRLRALELQLGAGAQGERSREQLDALAKALLDEFETARNGYFETAFEKGDDGTYQMREGAPPDPEKKYRPLIESLADAGSSRARIWVLSNTYMANAAMKEKLGGYLSAIAEEGLDADSFTSFGYATRSLVEVLGADFVEPRVRRIAARAEGSAGLGLLARLGESLCDATEADAAQRERGLALMREAIEGAPDSPEAQRWKGQVFRFTELVVGKIAPDFETADVDGNAFKLSDYDGKVVVLDFWGFW